MSSITCLACNVGFDDVDLGRLHYKTDWHRYNLKRKVANFVPVTLEKFQERLSLQEKQEQESASSQETCFCKPCNKVFSTSNAYENHIQSKKHKDVLSGKEDNKKRKSKRGGKQQATKQQGQVKPEPPVEEAMSEGDDDCDAESWDSYEEDTLGIEECLFCSFLSSSLENNVNHMTSAHGFFLPDAEYISDLEGLITYLGEKVGAGKVCLWCNDKGKRFHNTKDVQRHMVDKGHCKMLHDGNVVFEYADFYDYTPSYPDGADPETNPDEVINPEELETDGFSLTLPSGAQVGHRSLMRYYQQNLVPHTRDGTKKVLPKMLAYYKALGWTGTTGTQVAQRVKDVQYMQRLRTRYHMRLGVKANNFRHRFRDPNGP
ncbi:zinc finger protein 622 [Aplysia californica]|uniref:Zinc finger protein 622 n=1 Tax=Aplysia californica TaxID=6500 RepID=A0ABM1A877_APLCA|nr:zinc finger protein 622 [Aplysia californica]XP_005090746.1 zinc finger protein 622 [Aplysia californica]XP_005090747.1 zinc finger protein 622 [Aplysia californica]XP_012942699.1 zinc finger protein 622 [Aplysia californica]